MPVLLVARSSRWSVAYAVINQFGFWEVDPPDGNLLFWPDAAPLVTNSVRYVRTVETYGAGEALVQLSGSVTAKDKPWGIDDAIAYSGEGRFVPCEDAPAA